VDLAAGEGYELLVSAVAVADRDWCSVLGHGPAVRAAVQAHGGVALVRDASRFGRFGWINLIGLLARERGAATRDRLTEAVARMPSASLHVVLAGGLRTQLTDRIEPDRVRAALSGDGAARRELRRVLRSPGLLLDATHWLQTTPSDQVKWVLLRTIAAWPAVGDPRATREAARQARARRAELGGPELLRQVTPGIRYGPAVLDRVLLVSSPLVEPILISVDQADRTVIVHPPMDADGMADAAAVLGSHGAAVGDRSRVQIVQELRVGPRTLAELCSALDRPRTTLLHHLALLRAAGFVTLTVTAGEPNVYQLDRRGFDQLARAAQGFVLD
jgi:DNA-binding transcriptional ArsR family regulator